MIILSYQLSGGEHSTMSYNHFLHTPNFYKHLNSFDYVVAIGSWQYSHHGMTCNIYTGLNYRIKIVVVVFLTCIFIIFITVQ